MRKILKTVLYTAAATAGLAGLALAAAPAIHELTVDMPGGVAHIRYTGDVPPKVSFVSAKPVGLFAPFAQMDQIDQISALMNRQMAAMMLQARMMQMQALQNAPLSSAEFQALPAEPGYSVISALPGSSACMKTVQITASGNEAPKVVAQSFGNCGTAKSASPVQMKAVPAQAAPMQTISYKPEAAAHPHTGI